MLSPSFYAEWNLSLENCIIQIKQTKFWYQQIHPNEEKLNALKEIVHPDFFYKPI